MGDFWYESGRSVGGRVLWTRNKPEYPYCPIAAGDNPPVLSTNLEVTGTPTCDDRVADWPTASIMAMCIHLYVRRVAAHVHVLTVVIVAAGIVCVGDTLVGSLKFLNRNMTGFRSDRKRTSTR